jgi:5-aminopentanamidase
MRLACAQLDVAFDDAAKNIDRAIQALMELARQDVDLVVFPEAFLTGYCVDSHSEAQRIAIEMDRLDPLAIACERLAISCVVGFAERSGVAIYNAAALLEPGRPPRIYRKTHLPELGLDKFVNKGGELSVFDTSFGRVGVLICFDLRMPEASRVLALRGAELIVLPTNWPEGAETSAEHVAITRAAENRVFIATCNRVGTENSFRFIGRSKIIAPSGAVVASAGDKEEFIVADLDLSEARIKRNVMIPGKYETDVMGSRRPELYHEIAPGSEKEIEIAPEAPPIWV